MTPTHSSADHVEWIAQARRQAERARPSAGSSAADGNGASLASSMRPVLLGYAIRREVHRGGQGVVYEALQQSTGRTVALKVLREGPFAGGNDRQRFDREVSILATLNHRHIVRIIDRGAAAGSDYLVMDYVDGRPIDRYVREHDLSLRDRLQLFADVCDAVSAAHQRGVIHRDLKPGNILIDSAGEPRVLDFGLAKTTADGDVVHATQTGQFIGSLPWASPEQSLGQHADVDVRSDVYSLGVVLYQLLTGQFPYSTVGNLGEVLNRIRTAEPIRPRTIEREIDDDTETIVLKCLHKDPARRYQSVGELARDVRHYLANEPIEAKRDSGWYLLRKSLYRHRAATSIAAAFVLVVTVAAIALSVLYARSRALVGQLETSSRKVASEAAKSQQVASFAQQMLAGIDPATAGGMDKKLMRVVLDNAAKRVDTELADSPEVEAAVRRTIGKAYQAIGEYALAQQQVERTVDLHRRSQGENDAGTLKAMDDLAMIYWESGKSADAEKLSRAVLEIRRSTQGPDHPDTLLTMAILTEALHSQGDLEQAEALARETFERRIRVLGPEDPETLSSMNNLAGVLNSARRFDEAEPIYKQVFEGEKRVKGENHPDTLRTMSNLGALYHRSGRLGDAEPIFREIFATMKRVLGDDHPDTLLALGNLAVLLSAKGDYDQAEAILRSLIQSERRVLSAPNPTFANHLVSLASLVSNKGEHADAEALLREAIAINDSALPEAHPQRWTTRLALGICLARMKRFQDSEDLLVPGLEAIEGRSEIHQNWTISSIKTLVEMYDAWDVAEPGTGKIEKAAEWRRKLEAARAATQPSAPASQP